MLFINKVSLSSIKNQIIADRAASIYLSKLQESANIPEEPMDENLRSHAINPVTLRWDNFQALFYLRQKALLNIIETEAVKTFLKPETVE